MKNSHVDCIIQNWEIVTFIGKDKNYKVVRGIVIEDFKRRFDPGFWVCSTMIIRESLEENIVQTNNTAYKLVGEGETYETDNFGIYKYMMQGLEFQQAQRICEH